MKRYHVIIEDVQCYEFTIELSDHLTEEQRDEAIMDYCAENRCDVWRSGGETIVACDELKE
jgi:hypothetical protein